jgi:predicted ester cyclase
MSTLQEQNKSLIHRFFEDGINQNKWDVFDEIIAPSYVNYNLPAPAPGPEGLRQVVGMFKAGFPDLHTTVEAVIAEDDKVATRGYITGTHQGPFMNIPSTGKSIRVTYTDIWRIENGKAVENWVQMDMLGLMQQLGVIPTPG